MDDQHPLVSARRIVERHVPHAVGALLAGSVLTARRTDTSDLDIVVFVSEEDHSYRETRYEEGWLVELFVTTPSSFDYFVTQEIAGRRSPLLQMCTDGKIILSKGGTVERYQGEARRLLAIGPPPLSPDELYQRRYVLTALLDDLTSSVEGPELAYITWDIVAKATELTLSSNGKWLGSGKWLARRLEEFDPALHSRLHDAACSSIIEGDRMALRLVVLQLLERVGGPLSSGYRQKAPPQTLP